MTDEEAAAMLDAASSLHINVMGPERMVSYKFSVHIYSHNNAKLRALQDRYGGLAMTHRHRHVTTGRKAGAMLRCMEPYVKDRRVELRICLDFCSTHGFHPLTEEHKRIRKHCFLQMVAFRKIAFYDEPDYDRTRLGVNKWERKGT